MSIAPKHEYPVRSDGGKFVQPAMKISDIHEIFGERVLDEEEIAQIHSACYKAGLLFGHIFPKALLLGMAMREIERVSSFSYDQVRYRLAKTKDFLREELKDLIHLSA